MMVTIRQSDYIFTVSMVDTHADGSVMTMMNAQTKPRTLVHDWCTNGAHTGAITGADHERLAVDRASRKETVHKDLRISGERAAGALVN